jgi:hypothetical protein
MKIFIIYCLLFIHVNMCIFIRGFWVSIRVSGIRSGFEYPRVWFWFWWWISTRIGFRFEFRFRFRVSGLGARRLHPIRTRPVAILSWWCCRALQVGPHWSKGTHKHEPCWWCSRAATRRRLPLWGQNQPALASPSPFVQLYVSSVSYHHMLSEVCCKCFIWMLQM